MNYGSAACTCLFAPCSKSRFQFLQQQLQKLCLHVLDGTTQQEQIPIPPAVIISRISAACSNSHTGSFFQFTVVFHVEIERSICDTKSMGVPGCASTFAFYFLLPYLTICCEIMLSPQYNLVTKRYTIHD